MSQALDLLRGAVASPATRFPPVVPQMLARVDLERELAALEIKYHGEVSTSVPEVDDTSYYTDEQSHVQPAPRKDRVPLSPPWDAPLATIERRLRTLDLVSGDLLAGQQALHARMDAADLLLRLSSQSSSQDDKKVAAPSQDGARQSGSTERREEIAVVVGPLQDPATGIEDEEQHDVACTDDDDEDHGDVAYATGYDDGFDDARQLEAYREVVGSSGAFSDTDDQDLNSAAAPLSLRSRNFVLEELGVRSLPSPLKTAEYRPEASQQQQSDMHALLNPAGSALATVEDATVQYDAAVQVHKISLRDNEPVVSPQPQVDEGALQASVSSSVSVSESVVRADEVLAQPHAVDDALKQWDEMQRLAENVDDQHPSSSTAQPLTDSATARTNDSDSSQDEPAPVRASVDAADPVDVVTDSAAQTAPDALPAVVPSEEAQLDGTVGVTVIESDHDSQVLEADADAFSIEEGSVLGMEDIVGNADQGSDSKVVAGFSPNAQRKKPSKAVPTTIAVKRPFKSTWGAPPPKASPKAVRPVNRGSHFKTRVQIMPCHRKQQQPDSSPDTPEPKPAAKKLHRRQRQRFPLRPVARTPSPAVVQESGPGASESEELARLRAPTVRLRRDVEHKSRTIGVTKNTVFGFVT